MLQAKHELDAANGGEAKLIFKKCNRVFSNTYGLVKLQKINIIHNGTALNINAEQYD